MQTDRPLIPKAMHSALQGVVPATIATCAADGTPNATFISQVFYVDEAHVALSFQFMNKTWRNLQENPVATVLVTCPATFFMWKLQVRYLEKQTEGPIFDQMDMEHAALVSMLQVPVKFDFQAALICRVEAVEVLFDGT